MTKSKQNTLARWCEQHVGSSSQITDLPAHCPAATPDTAAYYTNTITWLRDTHPAYVKRMESFFPRHEFGASQ